MPSSKIAPVAQADPIWLSSLHHIQPVLLVAILQYSFKHMVADPTTTLTSMLLPLALVQTLYISFGLTSQSETAIFKKNTKPTKKGDALPSIVGTKIIPAFLSLLLTIFFAAPILFIITILFGAPLTTHTTLTALCALHISLLAVYPLAYVQPLETTRWREIISLQLPVDEVYGASLGTLFGCWLGAVPIPLDWDREWQKWPLTIVVGAYGGCVFGKGLGMVFAGKKLPF